VSIKKFCIIIFLFFLSLSLYSPFFYSAMTETIPDTSTKRVKTISAFSTFGGSWKTTAVATLSIKMADTGKNVGVVDLCNQGNLTHFFAEKSKLFSFDQLFRDANGKSKLNERWSRSFIDISSKISTTDGITTSLAFLPELGITIQERSQPDDKGLIQLMSWSPFQENFLRQLESETQNRRPGDPRFYSVFIRYIFEAFATKYDLDYIFVDLPRENNAITRSLIMRSDLVLFTVTFKTSNTFMAAHTLDRMNQTANTENFTNGVWQPVILPVFTGKTEYDPWDMDTIQSSITTPVSDRFMAELKKLWRKIDHCEFPEHLTSRCISVIHFDESFAKEELGTTCFDQTTPTSKRVRDDYDALIKKMIRLVSS